LAGNKAIENIAPGNTSLLVTATCGGDFTLTNQSVL
jgi:hypothetical protein